jgi:serine/threonine protein phosphatase PrpC
MLTQTQYFGASVTGPLHLKQQQPNEDAWMGARGSFGTLIVVCDGLGSKPQARHGSQMACLAVQDAVTQTTQSEALTELLEQNWQQRILPYTPRDCATTCLFALLQPNNQLVIGSIGDGLGVIKIAQQVAKPVLGQRDTQFANETIALGCSQSLEDWSIQTIDVTNKNVIAMLVTDGISDDLRIDKLDEFLMWLMAEFAPLPPSVCQQALETELHNWPTPHHLDDKTLAVLWTSCTKFGE